MQGYGRVAASQPPVFDTVRDLAAAWEFFEANSFVVVRALCADEVAALDVAADRWTREFRQQEWSELLFWPLIDYADDVQPFVRHPSVMPLVDRALGGSGKVRFQQCNWKTFEM